MNEAKGTHCGSWNVEDAKIVDDNGVASGVMITDGKNEIVTAADPTELMICLAMHLGVENWELSGDDR